MTLGEDWVQQSPPLVKAPLATAAWRMGFMHKSAGQYSTVVPWEHRISAEVLYISNTLYETSKNFYNALKVLKGSAMIQSL